MPVTGEYRHQVENAVLAKNLNISEENITAGHTVTASGNNICNHSTPYPLTLQKDINLTPGTNYVSGELTRTYARLRINVRNQSSMNDLYITNLSFPQNIGQLQPIL